jgi:hypothetical protein
MPSRAPSSTHDPELLRSESEKGVPISPLRLAMLRSLAAAHIIAGTLEFLKVAGNLLLRLPDTGGTLALPGVVTLEMARVLYDLSQGRPPASPNWESRTYWIRCQADTTGSFLHAMMAAHTVLVALNVILGLGLWRRQSWARWLDVTVLGPAALLNVAHHAAWFRVSGDWTISEIIVEAPLLVVPASIIAFLIAPRTGNIFATRDDARQHAESVAGGHCRCNVGSAL